MLLVLVVALLIVMAAAIGIAGRGKKLAGEAIKRKRPLTDNEQPMYFRLIQALPEHVVLAQVAFSALLTAKQRPTRNRFDRKVADFVVCTKSFDVVAVIELDDSSHRGREKQDEARDAILRSAGYTVLRYKKVPDIARLTADLAAIQKPETAKAA